MRQEFKSKGQKTTAWKTKEIKIVIILQLKDVEIGSGSENEYV